MRWSSAAFSWRNELIASEGLTRPRTLLATTLVFVIFTCFFLFFRSNDISAVDGAVRCLDIFRRGRLFFHENNHLLYPANVLVWTRFLSHFGIKASNPKEFYAIAQSMNCVAAAACLAMLFCLSLSLFSSLRLAFSLVLGYGFSKAFLLHATNSAEPVVGLFWSLLGICFASILVKRWSHLSVILSAICFSLAMASYQSMIFLAPAAIALIWQGGYFRDGGGFFSQARLFELGEFTLAGVVACAVLFGWAYWHQGLRSPDELIERLSVHGARVYLSLTIGKFLNMPIGLVRNIFPVVSYFVGIRGLLTGPRLSLVSFLLVLVGTFAFLFAALQRLVKGWRSLAIPVRAAAVAAAVGFTFTIIPLLVWDPQYDKLWLQPLACLAFLVTSSRVAPNLDGPARSPLSKVLPVLLLCGLAMNLVWLTRCHYTKTSEMSEAQRLAGVIGTRDLLVGDWDAVSTLYGYGWSRDGRFISFPTEAVLHGFDSVTELREAVRDTQRIGGRVYFLSLLDVPRASWDSFLGTRCGVPYSELDFYREHSKLRELFHSKSSELSLRQLDAPDSSATSQ